MPEVSVIIPAYNCEKFVSTAVESVLAQSYHDYEIIVVDDGSTDGTAEVLKRFGPAIRYFFRANGGPANARNTGIENAKGEYLAFLDSDDAWLPDKLMLQMPLFKDNAKAGLAYTDTYILRDGEFEKSYSFGTRSFPLKRPHRGMVIRELLLDNFIPTSSVIVRKECLKRVGLFNPTLSPIEDYDRWLRIALSYDIDYIDRPLVKYRDHPGIFTKDKAITVGNIINTLEGFLAQNPSAANILGADADRVLAGYYCLLSGIYISKGSSAKAAQTVSRALKLARSPIILPRIAILAVTECMAGAARSFRAAFKNLKERDRDVKNKR